MNKRTNIQSDSNREARGNIASYTKISTLEEQTLSYIQTLSQNAWINLGIGLVGVLAGTILLYVFIDSISDQALLTAEKKSQDLQQNGQPPSVDPIIHLYRLSIIFVLEVIGLFFLRLYRNGQKEIKDLQNHLSKIGFVALGIQIKRDDKIKDSEAIQNLILNILPKSQHIVLKKGETTHDLELKKAEQAEGGKILETLERFLDLFSKNKSE
ncbi:MAG: hypothetical protein AAF587_34645 [Bacteroidota bacterium]